MWGGHRRNQEQTCGRACLGGACSRGPEVEPHRREAEQPATHDPLFGFTAGPPLLMRCFTATTRSFAQSRSVGSGLLAATDSYAASAARHSRCSSRARPSPASARYRTAASAGFISAAASKAFAAIGKRLSLSSDSPERRSASERTPSSSLLVAAWACVAASL